jgi:hypothetical protein
MAIGPTEPPGQQTTGAVLPGGKWLEHEDNHP